mmetsp:Transcript_14868/g.30014  ORF Transcript_14868/g.30014 Transcript_14868/m.30014 type:complete len:208 (+) Transcript_14868:505-1128(+)
MCERVDVVGVFLSGGESGQETSADVWSPDYGPGCCSCGDFAAPGGQLPLEFPVQASDWMGLCGEFSDFCSLLCRLSGSCRVAVLVGNLPGGDQGESPGDVWGDQLAVVVWHRLLREVSQRDHFLQRVCRCVYGGVRLFLGLCDRDQGDLYRRLSVDPQEREEWVEFDQVHLFLVSGGPHRDQVEGPPILFLTGPEGQVQDQGHGHTR